MSVTYYIWDEVNDTVLMETDRSGNPTAVYTNEPGQFGALISERQGGQSQYYHFDAIGSTRQLTNSVAQVTDSYLYDAFGNTVQGSGTSVVPYHFVGRLGYYLNQELAEYYVRARHYAPSVVRWLSQGPIGHVDRSNLYEYVRNSPLMGTDPSGSIGRFVGPECEPCFGPYITCQRKAGWMYAACLGEEPLLYEVIETVGCGAFCAWVGLGLPCFLACEALFIGSLLLLTKEKCDDALLNAEMKCGNAYNQCAFKEKGCGCGPGNENWRP